MTMTSCTYAYCSQFTSTLLEAQAPLAGLLITAFEPYRLLHTSLHQTV